MELIALMLGCAGGGSVTLDDSASVDSSDTSDSGETEDSSDTEDTGEEEEEFEMDPDYVYFTQYWAWDDGPSYLLTQDGNQLPPLAIISYYDARFFDTQDDLFVCSEYFLLEGGEPTDAWGTYEFTLTHQPQWSDDPCDFGPGPMADKDVAFGVAEISAELAGQLEDAVGADYETTWAPYVLGTRVGSYEAGWALLLELDESHAPVPGDNCAIEGASCRESAGLSEYPGPSLIYGASWYLTEPGNF